MGKVSKVSVVVTAVEAESDVLARCLGSVSKVASEIILVNNGGISKINEVGRKFGAKIYSHKFVNYVEKVRNFGISKASCDWILVLDPDEEIPSSLESMLLNAINEKGVDYYLLARRNFVFGKWIKHSRWWPDYSVRLFRKGKVKWSDEIHVPPFTVGAGKELPADEKHSLYHYHYESIEQYLERMNRYTGIQAQRKKGEGLIFSWKDVIRRPFNEFFSRFFQGEGYKDGLHGLVLAGLQGFSEFVLYLKIWQAEKFREVRIDIKDVKTETQKLDSDFNYWIADTLFKETGSIKYKLKRKFKLP